MLGTVRKMLQLSIIKYIKYNYFSPNIVRDKKAYIFPYRGAKIYMDKTARLILHANLHLNYEKVPGSREECFVLLRQNSQLTIHGVTYLCTKAAIQLQNGAEMDIGRSYINHEAVLLAGSSMRIGDGILISRGVYIYDSDHHKILDEDGNRTNTGESVVIGNHVWIGLRATILRGSRIGDGAVVSAGSVVMGKVKAGTCAIGFPARSFSSVQWEE